MTSVRRKRVNCVKCSVKNCSVDITYSKNVKWLVAFILRCVTRQRTLVKRVGVINPLPPLRQTDSSGLPRTSHVGQPLTSFRRKN